MFLFSWPGGQGARGLFPQITRQSQCVASGNSGLHWPGLLCLTGGGLPGPAEHPILRQRQQAPPSPGNSFLCLGALQVGSGCSLTVYPTPGAWREETPGPKRPPQHHLWGLLAPD